MLYYIQVVVLQMWYQGGLRAFNQQDMQEWTNHEGATNYQLVLPFLMGATEVIVSYWIYSFVLPYNGVLIIFNIRGRRLLHF